jgi:phosphatidylethanolamine-binding protein (PEBP) family uncharacterized protein
MKKVSRVKSRVKSRNNNNISKKKYIGVGGSNGSNSSKSNNKKEFLKIFYNDVIIVDDINITGKDYKTEPTVVVNNANPKKIYMITMTDPDAPNGEQEKDKTINRTYTHWVYIQTENKKIIFVPYSPPTPPHGTHRYIFNLYDITNKTYNNKSEKISSGDLSSLRLTKEQLQVPTFRKSYNKKIKAFLKLNFKKLFKIQFKVNSDDVKSINPKNLTNIAAIQNIIKNKKKISDNNNKNLTKKMQLQQQQFQQQQQLQQQKFQQQQLQQQQQEIQKLKQEESNRPGFGTFLAADVVANILF